MAAFNARPADPSIVQEIKAGGPDLLSHLKRQFEQPNARVAMVSLSDVEEAEKSMMEFPASTAKH